MTWKAISREELDELIEQQLRSVDLEFMELNLRVYLIGPRLISCTRTPNKEKELVFEVASRGEIGIIYDDVEDEFATFTNDDVEDGVLHRWELSGSLTQSLRMMHILLDGRQ